jgi:hypothetical protein
VSTVSPELPLSPDRLLLIADDDTLRLIRRHVFDVMMQAMSV